VAGGEAGQSGADLLGVAVAKAVRNPQGVSQRDAGAGVVADGVVDISEVHERDGLLAPVAELAEPVEGLPVAAHGLGMLAHVVMGKAQAVPGDRLNAQVSQFLVKAQGAPAVADGRRVVAELGVQPADGVAGLGLSGPVAGCTEQVQGPLRMVEPGSVTSLQLQCVRQVVVGPRLPAQVSAFAEYGQGVPEVIVCLVEPV
jgi:hypothetical protein